MIKQNNHEAQAEGGANAVDRSTSLNTTKDPNQVDGLQLVRQIVEEKIVSKVQSEVVSEMTMVQTRVQDAAMTAIENLIFPKVKLAMKLFHASSRHRVGSVVMDRDRIGFSEKIEVLQMTTSSRVNSHIDL